VNVRREQRGSCLIEAGALDLQGGAHWKPWLRLTGAGGVGVSRTFDALKPVFGTESAALCYAAELGRSLAREGCAPDQASCDRTPVAWPLLVFARLRAYRSRALSRLCAAPLQTG